MANIEGARGLRDMALAVRSSVLAACAPLAEAWDADDELRSEVLESGRASRAYPFDCSFDEAFSQVAAWAGEVAAAADDYIEARR